MCLRLFGLERGLLADAGGATDGVCRRMSGQVELHPLMRSHKA